MNDIAHLSFRGGGLILPAHTPYDRELLVECVEASTKRYGDILLEVNGRRWAISMSNGLRPVCLSCSQWPDDLTYPGGSSGGPSVVSSRATPCTEITCELAQVGARASIAPAGTAVWAHADSDRQLG
jgi:hypothetical protein